MLAKGGRDTISPLTSTSRVRFRPAGEALSSRYGSGCGSRGGGLHHSPSRAANGVIHAEMVVAKDLPRKGPSGTYSQLWMSRADQSFSRHTPKTCSAKAVVGTGYPGREPAPITTPSSASKSSRRDGPKQIVPSASRNCPFG